MTFQQRSDSDVGQCRSVVSSSLSEPQAVELAKQFAALADPVRLRL